MAYVYKPDGFPWARFIITITYDAIFGLTLWALLSDHAAMAVEEVSIVSMLIGAMATGWKDLHAFWFRMDTPDNSTDGNGQNGAQPILELGPVANDPITTPSAPTTPAPTPAPQPPIDEEAERNRSFTAAQAAKRQEAS